MKTENRKKWGLLSTLAMSIMFLVGGLVLSVASALSLATISAGGKFNFEVPVQDESSYAGILKFYNPITTGAFPTISVCADPDTKKSSTYPTEVEIPEKITVGGTSYVVNTLGSFSASKIQSIIIPNTITKLSGDDSTGATNVGTFLNCSNLTSVTLPNAITTMPDGIFNSCSSLTRLNLPSSLESIPDMAFAGCLALNSITIPSEVISIGEHAFYDCEALQSITIPANTTYIGSHAFSNCSSLTSATFESKLGWCVAGTYPDLSDSSNNATLLTSTYESDEWSVELGEDAYFTFTYTNMVNPDTGNYIAKVRAKDPASLSDSDTIPDMVSSFDGTTYDVAIIEPNGFKGATNLTSYQLPSYIKQIGKGAFDGCTSLTALILSDTSYIWEAYTEKTAEGSCEAFSTSIISDSATFAQLLTNSYSGYTWESMPYIEFESSSYTSGLEIKGTDANFEYGKVLIPSRYFETIDSPTLVTEISYFSYTQVTEVIVPNSVMRINGNAFQDCAKLTAINIPEMLTTIEQNAFSRCTALTSVDFAITVGWMLNDSYSTDLSGISDPSVAATYLNDTYSNHKWTRNRGNNSGIYFTYTFDQENKRAELTEINVYDNQISDVTIAIPNQTLNTEDTTDTTIYTVYSIAGGFTINGGIYNYQIKSITFPESLQKISAGAFSNYTSYMYDENTTSQGFKVKFKDPYDWVRSDTNELIDPKILMDTTQFKQHVISDYASVDLIKSEEKGIAFTYEYNEDDLTATVTGFAESIYNSGSLQFKRLNIPRITTKEGVTYTVTSISDPDGGRWGGSYETLFIPSTITSISAQAFGHDHVGADVQKLILEQPAGWIVNGEELDADELSNEETAASYLSQAYAEYDWNCAAGYFDFSFNNADMTAVVFKKQGKTLDGVDAYIPSKAYNPEDEQLYTVTTIGDMSRLKMQSIVIPSSITNINAMAFYDCTNLTSVTFKVTKGWKTSNDVIFASSVLEDTATATKYLTKTYCTYSWLYDENAIVAEVSDYPLLTFSLLADNTLGVVAKDPLAISGPVEIPARVFFKADGETVGQVRKVTQILANAFDGAQTMTKITIPNTVTTIGNEAFARTGDSSNNVGSGLHSIVLPDSVTSLGDSVFANNAELTSVTLSSSLQEIPFGSFLNCLNLANITIPSSVTTIGEGAFASTALTSVTIPANVTKIGASAFSQPSSRRVLTSITFANANGWKASDNFTTYWLYMGVPAQNITYMLDTYFAYGFIRDTSVNADIFSINTSTRFIGLNTTYTKVVNGIIVIPEKVNFNNITSAIVGVSANGFAGATKVTSVSVPSGVAEIGASAFSGCTALKSINMPAAVKKIGANAFLNCSSLNSVTFAVVNGWTTSSGAVFTPNTMSSASTCATYLSTTYVADEWIYDPSTIIPSESDYPLLKFSLLDDNTLGVEAASTSSINGAVVIPSKILFKASGESVAQARTVTQILSNAFEGAKYLTSITIPDTITTIGDNAFKETGDAEYQMGTGLQSIVIPDSVKSIGYYAFGNNAELTSITLGSGISSIEAYTFFQCTNLQTITLPSGITRIGEGAFALSGLTSITIPADCNSIGASAFMQRTQKLTSVTFENTVGWKAGSNWIYVGTPSQNATYLATTYSSETFTRDTTLTEDVFNVSAFTSSAEAGLYDKTIAGTVVIPEKAVNSSGTVVDVKTISDSAFDGATGVTSVVFPSTIQTIGDYAFAGCTGLTSMTIPSSVTYIYSTAFMSTKNITSMTVESANTKYKSISNAIIEISTNTLVAGCKNTTVDSSVLIIGDYAFYGCDITSVTLTNVTKIGKEAFACCEKIKSITIPSTCKEIGKNSFESSGLTSATFANTSGWQLIVGDIIYPETFGNFAGQTAEENATDLKRDTVAWSKKGDYFDIKFATEGITAVNTSSKKSDLYIPESLYVNGVISKIVSIAPSGFANTKILTLRLPYTIQTISQSAFSGCTSLYNITIEDTDSNPSKLSYIFSDAFNGCSDLTSISFPASLIQIAPRAFKGTGLTSAYFATSTNWTVGSNGNPNNPTGNKSFTPGIPATNATYLTTTYVDSYFVRKQS